MKMNEIREMNDADLKKHVSEKREEIRKLRFGSAGSGMRDTNARKNARRAIARGLTEQNRRGREADQTNA